eukprot:SAG31_NODE_367_length_16811_cov_20.811584_5_plen_391_part_00
MSLSDNMFCRIFCRHRHKVWYSPGVHLALCSMKRADLFVRAGLFKCGACFCDNVTIQLVHACSELRSQLEARRPARSMLTQVQVEEWDRCGAVTVRTPLADDTALLQRVQAAMLRSMPPPEGVDGVQQPRRATNTNLASEAEPAIRDVLQHPWFERAAQQLLRSSLVFYNGNACAVSYPDYRQDFALGTGGYPEDAPHAGEHVDGQCTLEQWESREHVRVSFFIWLAEATATRAPLMYRPGSHRFLAKHNSALGEPRRFGMTGDPRFDPPWAAPGRLHSSLDELLSAEAAAGPPIEYSQLQPMQPAVGTPGSVTITTTNLVHALSFNLTNTPRMSMHLTFARRSGLMPDVVKIGSTAEEHWARLIPLLRKERRHIIASYRTNDKATIARL